MIKLCKHCGKEFKPDRKHRNYCSDDCAIDAYDAYRRAYARGRYYKHREEILARKHAERTKK